MIFDWASPVKLACAQDPCRLPCNLESCCRGVFCVKPWSCTSRLLVETVSLGCSSCRLQQIAFYSRQPWRSQQNTARMNTRRNTRNTRINLRTSSMKTTVSRSSNVVVTDSSPAAALGQQSALDLMLGCQKFDIAIMLLKLSIQTCGSSGKRQQAGAPGAMEQISWQQ